MTFILCSEGDQMLQVFSCQATAEHWAQRRRWGWRVEGRGGGGLVSVVFYYIMANGTESNLSTFQGEKALCVSECYQFLEQRELWTRTSCVWTTAARSSGTLLLIYNGGDVSACLLSEAKGWTFLLVNMLTVAWLWKKLQQKWLSAAPS